ncbi:MAG: hypothetical protein R3E42_02760 [Burkholderiaceae bacterium]
MAVARSRPGEEQAHAVDIFTPCCVLGAQTSALAHELAVWDQAVSAWHARDWNACEQRLDELLGLSEEKYLYRLYTQTGSLHEGFSARPGMGWRCHF